MFSQGAPSRRINMKLCSPVSSVFRPPLKLTGAEASLTTRGESGAFGCRADGKLLNPHSNSSVKVGLLEP